MTLESGFGFCQGKESLIAHPMCLGAHQPPKRSLPVDLSPQPAVGWN